MCTFFAIYFDAIALKEWHINADEATVLDYNLEFKPADQANLYQPDAFRASDHDPILVSLLLNHSPLANDDAYETAVNATLTVPTNDGVLANDFDPNEYETPSVALAAGGDPLHGDLLLNIDGSFVYTPDAGYIGQDSFTYIFSSMPTIQSSNEDSATVIITIKPLRLFLPIIFK